MPNPVLPSAATSHMSAGAYMRLRDSEHSPVEKFTVLYYGEIDGDEIVALLRESDRDTWIEEMAGSDYTFTYQEVSETADQVVLYDAARDRTLVIDHNTLDLTVHDDGTEVTHDIIDFAHSLSPYVT